MSEQVQRPPVPHRARPGQEWVAQRDPRWRTRDAGRCRYIVDRYVYCRKPVVSELNRGRLGADHWWAYCPEHLHSYGRWIEGGKVLTWALKETDQ